MVSAERRGSWEHGLPMHAVSGDTDEASRLR